MIKKQFILSLSLVTIAFLGCKSQQAKNMPMNQSTKISQHDTLIGIKGGDNAILIETKIGQKYVYPQAEIIVTLSEDGVGEEIRAVWAGQKDTFWIENIEAHHFFGLKDNFLFIDNGTAPNGRTIVVYDLKTRENIYEASYEKDISLKNTKMMYLSPIDTRNIRLRDSVCPDKDKWEKQGWSAGYGEYKLFDCQSKIMTSTGNYSCYPMQ